MTGIRVIEKSDYERLARIHEKFYGEEFDFPDFVKNFLFAFVIEHDGEIVNVSGIRTIVEAISVTNKDMGVRVRREALYKTLETLAFIAKSNGYNQLHAFIQDSNWEEHLRKVGFKETKGKALVIEV